MSITRAALIATAVATVAVLIAPSGALAGQSPERLLIKKVNRIRHDNGLHGLRTSKSLKASSRRYARWMMGNDYFGHRSSIRASGAFGRLGEVLYMRRGSKPRVGEVVRGWMNSPTHRYVLMNRRLSYIGVGRARGSFGGRSSTIWVGQLGLK